MLRNLEKLSLKFEATVHNKKSNWDRHKKQKKKMKPETPEGFHQVELNKTEWTIPIRYQNLKPLAAGAFGCVCSADDMITGQRVAVKKIGGAFQSAIYAKRIFREIQVLSRMQHENVIALHDIFTPDMRESQLDTVYLVTTLMDGDLEAVVGHHRKLRQSLSQEQVQFLIYQVVRGLKYIHSAGIIHRDLKPQNLGINTDCQLRIIDFGLARLSDPEMTGYITTRWWRAPEVMLNWMKYDQTIDVWSVGCIMAEMLLGEPLFTGRDHIDQLKKIMSICGTPSESFIKKVESPNARCYLRSMPQIRRRDFSTIFPNASMEAIDFLEQTLEIDPNERISVSEMLSHPYLATFHDPSDEPEMDHSVAFTAEVEDQNLNESYWRELAWNEIIHFQLRQTGGDLCSEELFHV